MKDTSKQAYKKCKESGYMTRKQKEVYNWIANTGPMTAAEINKATESTSNHKRLSELADKGLIVEAGERLDRDTRKMATLWAKAPVGHTPRHRAKSPATGLLGAKNCALTDGRIASKHYDSGFINGWTACINSLKGAVPVMYIIPPKVLE